MKVIKELTFADAYKKLLEILLDWPEYVTAPRNQKIHEFQNFSLEITNPVSCLFENERRSSQLKYISAELLWYLVGDNKAEFISHFSKFWKTIQNSDGTVNSAYGHLIFKERYNPTQMNQWQWCYESLAKDKETRQAIMHFNKPWHQFSENKDFVCTMYSNFLIRDNKLHMTVHMRSNDAILGLPTDIPFFVILQLNMWNLLRELYPDLEIGTYTHIVNSMHLYERNHELVKEMLEHSFKPMDLPKDAEKLISSEGDTTQFIYDMYWAVQHRGFPREPKTEMETFISNQLIKEIS